MRMKHRLINHVRINHRLYIHNKNIYILKRREQIMFSETGWHADHQMKLQSADYHAGTDHRHQYLHCIYAGWKACNPSQVLFFYPKESCFHLFLPTGWYIHSSTSHAGAFTVSFCHCIAEWCILLHTSELLASYSRVKTKSILNSWCETMNKHKKI